jgi:hypothetical protein
MITYTGKILDTTTSNQNHRVFLQVMALTRYIATHLETVRETYTGDLT